MKEQCGFSATITKYSLSQSMINGWNKNIYLHSVICPYSATRGIHVELLEDKDLIVHHHPFDGEHVEYWIHTNEDLGTNQFIFL